MTHMHRVACWLVNVILWGIKQTCIYHFKTSNSSCELSLKGLNSFIKSRSSIVAQRCWCRRTSGMKGTEEISDLENGFSEEHSIISECFCALTYTAYQSTYPKTISLAEPRDFCPKKGSHRADKLQKDTPFWAFHLRARFWWYVLDGIQHYFASWARYFHVEHACTKVCNSSAGAVSLW